MIKLTRLNNTQFYINPLLFQTLEVTPDTIISLTTGKKYVVKETAEEVVLQIKQFLSEVEFLKVVNSSAGVHDV